MGIPHQDHEVIEVLICEDEKLIASRLARFIEDADVVPVRVRQVHNLSDAQGFIAKHKIDLLFLDLNLHQRDGFELLNTFLSRPFHTIVVSAYTERAIEAYEYGALDFIGKPFTPLRVLKSLQRYQKGLGDADRKLRFLAVRGKRQTEFVPLEDIKLIKAASIYAELHLSSGAVKIYDKPLSQLEKLLPVHFQRVHKSYMVNTELVTAVNTRKTNNYSISLSTGDEVPLSRNKRPELIAMLGL